MQTADSIYFIDPVQAPTLDLPDNPKLLVFERYNIMRGDFTPGSMTVDVTGISFDGYGHPWYTDSNRDWYRGAIINDKRVPRGVNAIGMLGDVAVFGVRYQEYAGHTVMHRVRRSDQKRYGTSGEVQSFPVTQYMKAAPWAPELWPVGSDSAEVVEAKVAKARVMWDQRIKHAFILREGMHRSWLNLLREDGIHSDHGLPYPRWDVLVEGSVIIDTGNEVMKDRSDVLASVGSYTADLLNGIAQGDGSIRVMEKASVPIRTTVTLQQEIEDRHSAVDATRSSVTEQLQTRIGNYSAEFLPSSVRPLLSNLV